MKTQSDYLLGTNNVRRFDSELARIFGVTETFILCQLQYWIEEKKNNPDKYGNSFIDGRIWVYNSYSNLQKQLPFIKATKLRTAIYYFRDLGIILEGNYNTWIADKTKWYSIDYDRLDEIVKWWYDTGQNDTVKSRQDTVRFRQCSVKSRQCKGDTLSDSDNAIPIITYTINTTKTSSNNTLVLIKNEEQTDGAFSPQKKQYQKRFRKVKTLTIPSRFSCVSTAEETEFYHHLIVYYLKVYKEHKGKEHDYYEPDYWDVHVSSIHEAITDHFSNDDITYDRIEDIVDHYFNKVKERFNRNFASFANYKMITGILNKLFDSQYDDYDRAGMMNR